MVLIIQPVGLLIPTARAPTQTFSTQLPTIFCHEFYLSNPKAKNVAAGVCACVKLPNFKCILVH